MASREQRAERLRRFLEVVDAQVYSEPEEGNFHSKLIEQVVARFFDPLRLPQGARILDLGCGQGKFLGELRRRGYTNTVGVTLSPEDAATCRAAGHAIAESDFSFLDAPDRSADLIWCRHALEHSPFPYLSLLEFHRVLKPGGHLYVEVPAPDGARAHEANPNHYSILGGRMWLALFERAGFQPLDVQEIRFDIRPAPSAPPVPEQYYIFLLRCREG